MKKGCQGDGERGFVKGGDGGKGVWWCIIGGFLAELSFWGGGCRGNWL